MASSVCAATERYVLVIPINYMLRAKQHAQKLNFCPLEG
jgi:hypothetical protein